MVLSRTALRTRLAASRELLQVSKCVPLAVSSGAKDGRGHGCVVLAGGSNYHRSFIHRSGMGVCQSRRQPEALMGSVLETSGLPDFQL